MTQADDNAFATRFAHMRSIAVDALHSHVSASIPPTPFTGNRETIQRQSINGQIKATRRTRRADTVTEFLQHPFAETFTLPSVHHRS